MYKHPPSKRRKIVLKTLAYTRKLLIAIAEDFETNADVPLFSGYGNQRPIPYEDMLRIKKAQMIRAVNNLRARKFIEVRKKGDKVMFILTSKGKLAALKERVRLASKRSDGKILLVSFDIPEQEHLIRSKLRYMLKDLGFERIQMSLWGSKLDVGEQIAKLVKDMGAQKWIRIFLSSEVVTK